jgi:hypothetical protein
MLTIIFIVFSNLLWGLYSIVEGFRDGFFYYYKKSSHKNCFFEVSPIIILQRFLVLFTIGFFLLSHTSILVTLMILISMFLMFSFIYTGSYYYTRKKLNERSNPIILDNINYKINIKKTILMSIGIILQVFACIFLIK